ncbi:MAG: ATP synthase F1 subunit gamma [Bacteroidales bacterium]|nr:ATP synthase F1 subunit gamma [Bacteroidales bacterium]
MPNLKEVRTRIESVNSTKQITSAMKMVAASKLRKAQNAIITMRPYAAKLHELMKNLSRAVSDGEGSTGQYTGHRDFEKVLIIPVTSNRGLCGAFNANVIRATVRLVQDHYSVQLAQGNLSLYCIGKKGEEFFRNRKYSVIGSGSYLFDNLSFANITPVAAGIMDDFAAEKYDQVIFVYNRFKNAGTQVLTTERFLPVELPEVVDSQIGFETDYIFEPGKDQILNEIIPKTLKIQFYKVLLDSFASEHGARMVAMNKATDNAAEMLKELKLSYNKARQASITKEILEIVGGANALNG